MIRSLTVPWQIHLAAVGLQAAGLWMAGDGRGRGWLVAAVNSVMWAAFALVTAQWLLLAGPVVLVSVKVRNYRRASRPVAL